MVALAESLAGSYATYFMAGIVIVWAALRPLGKRALTMGPLAWLPVILYVLNTAIVTSYHRVADEDKAVVWTVSLLAVGLIYIAVLCFRGVRTQVPALFAAWVIAAYGGAMAADTDLLRKMFWVFQYAGFATMAFVLFLTIPRTNIIALATGGVLFIAEWVGVFQIVDCQFLHGMAGKPIVEGSACAAVYGWSFAPHVPTTLTALLMCWPVYRWLKPRRP